MQGELRAKASLNVSDPGEEMPFQPTEFDIEVLSYQTIQSKTLTKKKRKTKFKEETPEQKFILGFFSLYTSDALTLKQNHGLCGGK